LKRERDAERDSESKVKLREEGRAFQREGLMVAKDQAVSYLVPIYPGFSYFSFASVAPIRKLHLLKIVTWKIYGFHLVNCLVIKSFGCSTSV